MSFRNMNIFGFNDYGLPLKSRIGIYKGLIRPIMEYGLCLCEISKTQMKKLESAQHYYIPKLFSISSNSNRNLLLSITNTEYVKFRSFYLKVKMIYRLISLANLNSHKKYLPSLLIKNKLHPLGKIDEINELVSLDIKVMYKKLQEIKSDNMAKLWNLLKNRPIPSPVDHYIKHPKQMIPILTKCSSRTIRTMIFNKFPGAPVTCKLCHQTLHSYMSHRSKCLALPDNEYDKFLELDTIKSIDWNLITDKEYICNLAVELRNIFT